MGGISKTFYGGGHQNFTETFRKIQLYRFSNDDVIDAHAFEGFRLYAFSKPFSKPFFQAIFLAFSYYTHIRHIPHTAH